MPNNKKKSYLTPNEVAELLMVSPVTVRQWAQKGQLKAETTLGGHRRFMYQEVVRFANANGLSFNVSKDQLKLLIVDDEEQLARFLKELITVKAAAAGMDIQIEVVNNGFDAGTKVHSFEPTIVLLDLMMPGINGIEVCRRIKADPSTRSIRIIAMTGFHVPENVDQVLSAGAEECLAKPIDTEILMKSLGIPLAGISA